MSGFKKLFTMGAHKWTKFTITADIDTEDLRSVYLAWATPGGLERWFLKEADFYTIGKRLRAPDELINKEDTYEWLWFGYDDVEKGTILEANGSDFLKFGFSGKSEVSVSMESKKGLTIVELTQKHIPKESDPTKNLYILCMVGWTFYLANLKSVMGGGLDLRNKRADIKSSLG